MTTTTGTLIRTYATADGRLKGVFDVRLGVGRTNATVTLPPGFFDVEAVGGAYALEHEHGDVFTWVDQGAAQEPVAATVSADPEAEARAMIVRLREAFGPVEIRVFETAEDGTRRLVSSNVKGEVQ